jgi:GAF domain
MNINITLCGQLCDTANIKGVLDYFRGKNKNKEQEMVLQDIQQLVADPQFDTNYLCHHILNKLVQLTGSEYGFLSEVKIEDNNYVLYTRAVTNIAWNSASHQFFTDYINCTMRFDNMDTLFGEVVRTGKFQIYNTYDNTRDVLPDGHPRIKRFMGIPALMHNVPVLLLGVCNKMTKYTKRDVDKTSILLNILSWMFIDMNNLPRRVQTCSLLKQLDNERKKEEPL